jgi:hypothetical protein
MSVGRKPTGQQRRAVMSNANRWIVLNACQLDAVASFSHTTRHPVVSDVTAPYVCVQGVQSGPCG